MKSADISLVLAALWLAAAHGYAGPRELSDEFLVADGLEVTLWAESPLFFKPTNIDVDSRGRIWVAEGVNYRSFRGNDANQPEAVARRHPEGDRILILEDTDGDGAADSSKVFVQEKDLVAPLGVAVFGQRVFVSCSPHLLAYTIDESGDKPAGKEVFLTGFGGHDHDHGLHSVVAGPDGRLYFNAGNAGPHIVTGRDGWTLRAGSIYTGGSPHNTTNLPNMRSDDGRVWTGGLALRIDPDGRNLTALAHNFRNSYEVAIDSFGDLWQNDNDDEVRACRASWVMEGGNMGFFSADGTRTWFRPSDVAVGADGAVYVADWHDPVVGGHAMRSPNGHGRILRITPRSTEPRAPKLDLSTTAGQVAALGSPAINVRFAAREILAANLALVRPLLEELSRRVVSRFCNASIGRRGCASAGGRLSRCASAIRQQSG